LVYRPIGPHLSSMPMDDALSGSLCWSGHAMRQLTLSGFLQKREPILGR